MKSNINFFASLLKIFKTIAVISLIAFGPLTAKGGGVKFTKFTNPNICASSYPSPYSTGSFAITEKKTKDLAGFTSGQTNATLIFGFSNSNLEFKANAGTVTATGTEVTISSYVITSTSITVTLSTSSNNVESNVLNFNNIQIRATSAGSGTAKLIRTGGTFKIDNTTDYPKTNFPLGSLTVSSQNILNSTTATQTETSKVYAGSTNNHIIGVQLVLSGTCGIMSATSFSFNTTGSQGSTNASGDISNAKLYYTGTSNKFATTTLFGSTTSPSGAFSITGNQTLGAGTYYFWLTYDLKSTATSGNYVDAKYVSTTVGGTNYTPTTSGGNPTGSRQISSNNYYSIAAGDWSSTSIWTQTLGSTTSCNCAPTGGSGFVYVNHAVSVNGNYTVDYVTVQSGGNLSNAMSKKLTINNILATSGSGLFTISMGWTLNDVTLEGTGSSSSSNTLTINGNLSIGSGTTFTLTSNNDLTVKGEAIINGTLDIKARTLTISGTTGYTVSGAGTVNGTGTFNFSDNRSISSGSSLTIAPSISIANGIVVTNWGTVIAKSILNGSSSDSKWINGTNSILEMDGTSTGNVLLATGTLDATTYTPNTVKFSSSASQNIPGFTYDILSIEGSSNVGKVLATDITVNSKIQITGSNYLDANSSGNYSITLNGDWVNNGTGTTFNARTGTVYFNDICSISGTARTTFNNIYINDVGSLTAHPTTDYFYVTGNWTNDGDFDNNNSDVTFSGTSMSKVLGASETWFYTANVLTGKPFTLHPTETYFEGNFVMNGELTDNGTSNFGGTSSQSITGGTIVLKNVTIDNSSGLTLIVPVTIVGVLTLTNGALVSNGKLTMDLNTGAIAGTGSGSITGNLTVKRSTGSGGFHYLSPVLNNITVADWNDDLPNNGNYYLYDETRHGNSVQGMDGWTGITSTAVPLTPLQGFALNFSGNTSVDETSTYTHGATPANLNLTCTAPHSLGIDGWNLVGNPYPSNINWDASTGWTKTNVLNGIYFWDPVNSRYASYIDGVSSPAGQASNLIAPMTGFYVRVDTTKSFGTLGVTNAVRTTTSGTPEGRIAAQNNILRLTLSSGNYYDETVLRISDQTTDHFDGEYDAYKLSNEGNTPTFYTTLNGDIYSINSFPLLSDEKIVPLNMFVGFGGTYSISANELNRFDNSISCILEDKATNQFQDMRTTSSYEFNADNAGGIYNRFYIHLKTQAPTAVNPLKNMMDESVNISASNSNVNILFKNQAASTSNIVIVDRLGREVRNVENANISTGSYSLNLPGQEGIFMVKVVVGESVYTSKVYLGQ